MPRALIVDDKPENLYLLNAILSANGYTVDRATNGIEALASAKASRPDLIVSDILMPGMDGFALCRQWKTEPSLSRIPFVFYTATYTDPKDEQLALSLGADRFLVKPMEPDAFMNEILEVVHEHQAGELLQPPPADMGESSYLREYNAALIHKLEDKLVEVERANKIKDTLLASVSHELRTPLTPVMLLVGILTADPCTPPAIRRDLQVIRRHIEIEKRLIGDLLDYAAMHSGCLSLHKEPLSLHTLILQAEALWQDQIRAEQLHIELLLEAAVDSVEGDKGRLEQVLWNLIYHAVRRSKRDGSLMFHTWNSQPDRITLEVRDAGCDMDAESITWAFSPLEREIRVGERGVQALGLGLAISKHIIEAHDGNIGIRSQEQPSGVTVTVDLPVRGSGID